MEPMTIAGWCAAALCVTAGAVLLRRRPAAASIDLYADYALGPSIDDHAEGEFDTLLAETSFTRRVVAPMLRSLSTAAARVLPSDHRRRLERKLVLAGLRGRLGAEEVHAAQFVGTAVGGVLGFGLSRSVHLTGPVSWLFIGVLAIIGWTVPNRMLERRIEARRAELRRDLPSVIDLLRVAIIAGSGLEQAIRSVVGDRPGVLSDELRRLLAETSLGSTRREALEAMRDRIDVPDVAGLVLALLQADELGMPLGRALDLQAKEIRLRRQQWAREKAAKLPVKVLVPLVLFIFPPILAITLGPAISSITGSM